MLASVAAGCSEGTADKHPSGAAAPLELSVQPPPLVAAPVEGHVLASSRDDASERQRGREAGRRPRGHFHLQEATIASIHDAFEQRELDCNALVRLYLKRIKAYSGHCVAYDRDGDRAGPDYDFFLPSGKGAYLGVVQALPNAGRVNAIQSVNLRPSHYAELGFAAPHDPGPRSETDLVDADPRLPDALEVAERLDREFRATQRLRPLHCIPIVIKDQLETIDLRTTDGSLTQFVNDRPATDGALVAKLRDAGAIIIAKANMDEYALGTHRSSYGGQVCNPYATNRNGGTSSTGTAAAVSTNLAVCGIGEESGGSIQDPAKKQSLVGVTGTRGLVSRFGSWPAELLRERFGPICRTVDDAARVLDAIRGYDPRDPITATQVGLASKKPFADFTRNPSLVGKRIGVVREFAAALTVNDRESVRVFNDEVIPALRRAGAELVESVNPRDIENGWTKDDPAIPNFSIQDVVAQLIPTLEPSFANPSTLDAPSPATGILPSNLRQTLATVPVSSLYPADADIIAHSVDLFFGAREFPDVINLRKLATTPAGILNEGRYALDRLLRRRGDPRVKSVLDLSIDFDDLNHNGDATEHISFRYIADDATGTVTQKARPAVTPGASVPATANGRTLDTQGQAGHLFRAQAIREIVAQVLAQNQLDALVYPFETIPSPILAGTAESIAWLTYDGRTNRGNFFFSDISGLPSVGVQAGFTRVVYDRTTRGAPSEALALDPPGVARNATLPFGILFLGRPWSEPTLLEIAAAYEAARGPRVPPPGFGPIPSEP